MMENSPKCRMYSDLAWTWPIISPPEEYENEATQFREAIEAHARIPVKSILDLGSGGGHNDVHLKKWYKVTGLDLSPKMMDNARKLNPEVEYIYGDMRTARLEKKFDAVVLADAVMYMATEEDLLAAFKTGFHHLNPGGILVTYVEETHETFEENRTDISFRGLNEVRITLMENIRRTGPHTYQSMFLYLIEREGNYHLEAETHNMGLFELETWHRLLEEAGFKVHVMEFLDEKNYPMFIGVRPTE